MRYQQGAKKSYSPQLHVPLLKHNEMIFEDVTIHLTGHWYEKCEFKRCTLVLKGFPCVVVNNIFRGCVLEIDYVLYNADHASELISFLENLKEGLAPSQKELAKHPESAQKSAAKKPHRKSSKHNKSD